MSVGSADWLSGFTQAIDTRDVDELLPYFAVDASFRYGNRPAMIGHDQIRDGIGAFYSGISGISHTAPHQCQPSDDVLVAEFLTDYRRLDGQVVTLPGMGVFEFKDGLIQDYRVYADVMPVFAP